MKRIFTFLLCSFAACSFALAQTTEADILKLEDRLLAAMLNNGVAELELLADQELQNLNQFGERNDRARFLTLHKTFKPTELTHSAVKVRIAGDAAIVNGDKREVSTSNFGRPQYLHFMDIWVKRADGWKLLTRQQQFDVRDGTRTPAGWRGQSSVYHLIGTDTEVKHGGNASLFIKSKHTEDRNIATGIYQTIKADAYRGKRIKLTGYVKGSVAFGLAYPWMRVNAEHDAGEILSFDNRLGEGFFVRPDWNQFSIVLDVPEASGTVILGFQLNGRGHVWLDDWQIEIVGKDIHSTNQPGSERALKQMETMRTTAQGKQEIENAKLRLATMPTTFTNLDFETPGKP